MEIKKGYKMTEIGLIPEGWEIVEIGEKFSFKNGLNKAKEFFGYGTPIINYMDVFNNSGIHRNHVKGKVFLTHQEKENYKDTKTTKNNQNHHAINNRFVYFAFEQNRSSN